MTLSFILQQLFDCYTPLITMGFSCQISCIIAQHLQYPVGHTVINTQNLDLQALAHVHSLRILEYWTGVPVALQT